MQINYLGTDVRAFGLERFTNKGDAKECKGAELGAAHAQEQTGDDEHASQNEATAEALPEQEIAGDRYYQM